MEVASREYLKGNIYKAVVSSVMPGLQAVFVDFGHKRHGFLQFHDVMPELYQSEKEGGQEGRRNVQNSLVKGQEILVQVTKDGHGAKGASLTTWISIPGRYVVMMPGQKRVGISRKIENREDRDRLKETFNSLNLPKDMGFILRTACSDSLEEELSRDLKYLTKLWDRIKSDAAKAKAPALIYREQDIAMRTVRDYLNPEVVEILIDDPKTCVATKAFLKRIMPWRKVNVVQYKEKEPLFSLYNLEEQIARLSQRTVMLPSKGYLVFDKTEALTAIDINSGRSRKEDNVESTALTTNMEAAREVARQLRLRDIGGLVVIDFIDMESAKNRKLVEAAMAEAVSTDRANIEIAALSKFCMLEMSRERLRPAYSEAISNKCPMCDGRGSDGSDEFIAISAMRELHAMAAAADKGTISAITCRLPVASSNILLNTRKREIVSLEQEYDITITVIADPSVPLGRYLMDAVKQK
jgi:ribonuclease E